MLLRTLMETWLRQAIDSAVAAVWGKSARVSQVVPLAGDASSRSYVRIYLDGSEPATAVVMVLAGSVLPLSSDELAVFAEPLKELPYLSVYRFLQPLGVRVPELYYDGHKDGFLLLEDIGNVSLREAAQGLPAAEVEHLYRLAIDQLVLLQIKGTRRRDDSCIAFQQRFDHRLFLWEFEHFIEWGLEKREGRSLPAAEGQELRTMFEQIATRLDRTPMFLNHRDYHSWNLFVQNNEIRVIDFQDALLAPASYDLATLLNDRDTPTVISPTLEQSLVDYYHTAWRQHGGDSFTHDLLWEEYNLCLLQKACKVVGRFYYLELEKGKTGYMRYIPPTLATIRRVLGRLPQYGRLQEIVAAHFPK
ncbi:MAG: phosphotransferase [Deltaproteobacteria bacterium]|nr:phosphotransferase [Deltaproteobacteria bacterium]